MYFHVDFVEPLKIQGVELQGIKDGQKTKLVRSFNVMYGYERNNLKFYEDPIGHVKVRKYRKLCKYSVNSLYFSRGWIAVNVTFKPYFSCSKYA